MKSLFTSNKKLVQTGFLLILGVITIWSNTAPVVNAYAETDSAACSVLQKSQDSYDFIRKYNSTCASKQNWDRTFNDAVITTNRDKNNTITLLASTSLGGAIASVKMNGKEFIDSGGHGTAMGYNFHAWDHGGNPSECYNPTQNGSTKDDEGKPAPFHGPSTSALYMQQATQASSLSTNSRLAMFVPRTSNNQGFGGCRAQDFQPNTSPFTYGLSPYWLSTTHAIGKTSNKYGLENVIRSSAVLSSEDRVFANFDGIFKSYLLRDFTDVYTYNPKNAQITKVKDTIASSNPLIRCTTNQSYCLGMYFNKKDMPSGAYYYAMTSGPNTYNGMGGEYTLQITSPSSNIGRGATERISYTSYTVLGTLKQVKTSLTSLNK